MDQAEGLYNIIMDDNNLSKEGFLENLQELVFYTDLPQDRKDYFADILTPEKIDSITPDDAGELMMALPKAQQVLEKMVVDSKDPEKIYALAELKSFTTDLMDGSEEEVLQEVLAITGGGNDTMPANISPQDRGEWLLNKLAGVSNEKQPESAVEEASSDNAMPSSSPTE